jgi:hypothetical protein
MSDAFCQLQKLGDDARIDTMAQFPHPRRHNPSEGRMYPIDCQTGLKIACTLRDFWKFDRLSPSRYNTQSSSVIGVYPRVREAPTPSDRCGRGSDSVSPRLCQVWCPRIAVLVV